VSLLNSDIISKFLHCLITPQEIKQRATAYKQVNTAVWGHNKKSKKTCPYLAAFSRTISHPSTRRNTTFP